MSFYLRKSVKAGPFRFNMSKSGIGVSVGIPGFRVGTGPRGSYVHMGRGGVSYRSTLTTPQSSTARPRQSSPVVDLAHSSIPLQDTTGATVVEMSSTSPSDVLAQINEAASRRSTWWIAAILAVAALTVEPPWGPIAATVVATGAFWLFERDAGRRSVVLFYDINDGAAAHYDQLIDAFSAVRSCHSAWQHTANQRLTTTHDRKVNAGASDLVQRRPLARHTETPAVIKTNIAVPSLAANRRTVALLPDRILIQEGRRFAEVGWPDISVDATAHQFIEDGAVPKDAQQVGSTWKYVNKKGGPDRRYKDNRELPIMLYGRVTLTAPNGFMAIWSISRLDATEKFAKALLEMKEHTTQAG